MTEPPFRSYIGSKWGHRPKTGSVTKNQRCCKKLTLLYFWSDRFETNRTWSPSIGAHVLFVLKRSGKNKEMLIFHYTEFALRQISEPGSTSAPPNSALKPPYTPSSYIFWPVWTWGFTTYHNKYTIPIKKLVGGTRTRWRWSPSLGGRSAGRLGRRRRRLWDSCGNEWPFYWLGIMWICLIPEPLHSPKQSLVQMWTTITKMRWYLYDTCAL